MPVVIKLSTASAADLRERFLFSDFFYLILLPAVFKASLGASSSISKLAGLHTDLQNSPTLTIHLSHNNPQKKYSGRFCLRVMASQLHNEESAPCGIRTLFTIVEMLKAIWFICLTTVFMIWLKNYSCPSVFNKKNVNTFDVLIFIQSTQR